MDITQLNGKIHDMKVNMKKTQLKKTTWQWTSLAIVCITWWSRNKRSLTKWIKISPKLRIASDNVNNSNIWYLDKRSGDHMTSDYITDGKPKFYDLNDTNTRICQIQRHI